MTTPPNAPEAGSNGEREALIDMIRRTWPAVPGELADAILAAGFTRRAQHDGGERVARETWTNARDAALRAEAERDALAELQRAIKQIDEEQEIATRFLAGRDASDKRAAALAEVLTTIRDEAFAAMEGAGQPEFALYGRWQHLARAALAGNGNGNGTGE